MKRFLIKINVCVLLLLSFIINIEAKKLYVGGQSVGVVLYYEGVYVSGTYPVNINNVFYDPLVDSNIEVGDLIVGVNDTKISSVEDLYVSLVELAKKDVISADIKLIRDSQHLNRKLNMDLINDVLTCGLYVKDSATGIGTLTYIDVDNMHFGALGHNIVDDTKYYLNAGNLYETSITGIKKTTRNNVGEKIANSESFVYLGKVFKNNGYGIYGSFDEVIKNPIIMDSAMQSEVVLGPATIRTVLHNTEVNEFAIEITKINHQSSINKKGIQFKITDQKLIANTGGVIQGMSGSPIIQNGKIIGAVTHVIVNDPLLGYGVFIEFMLENSN